MGYRYLQASVNLKYKISQRLITLCSTCSLDPHPFHADPDQGSEIFADPDPGFEIFVDRDPGLNFFPKLLFYIM